MSIVRKLVAVAVMFASPAHVHAQGLVAKLVTDPFDEKIVSEAQVSGNEIVGIVVSPYVAPATQALAVFVPGRVQAGERLCIKALSRDGTYVAVNEYELPEVATGGYVSMPYPTQYSAELSEFGSDALAVLAAQGGCQRAARGPLLVAGWLTGQGVLPKKLRIYVNSGRAETTISIAGRKSKSCELIREGRRTTFDTVCSIDDADQVKEFRLSFSRYERVVKTARFQLMLSGKN